MENVIIAEHIVKNYGKKCVLNDVSLVIKKGEIYGLIGKNGAGKTTLMKIITGIIFPTKGSLKINESENLNAERKKIGALIEQPSFYPTFSARKNLELFATVFKTDPKEIDNILELVGLSDTGMKPASKFSLGMKQRLGIAIALLGNPEILILDEPVNGLDPEGIKDIRDLLIKLNKENGTTIIISSHLLDELAKIATTYTILNKGDIVEVVTAKELEQKLDHHIKIVTNDNQKAKELIVNMYAGIDADIENDGLIIRSQCEKSSEINKLLITNNIEVKEFAIISENLEDYFIKKLKDSTNI